ncbi:MAG TPA: NAD(P)-dependent oxidoreductase [Bacteroidales bacterium]|nr:NAD(P)-dependent oxidoreductase [Bacteroidales bacterium]HPS16172.1 NAD(P)-dependent oxidoreductase [Bacteroidales bacterium]
MKKVLIIDSVHPILIKKLENAGFTCDDAIKLSRAEIEKIIHYYHGIIIRSRITIDKSFISIAKNLEFIGRVGSGMETIDVAFAEKKKIKCFNSPEGNRDAVGEHALGMLLSLMNNMNRADKQVRSGKWNREENRGEEINGKTIGIIGYGNMGSAFARRLSGFGANVIAYDKYKNDFSDKFVKEVNLSEIFKKADIVSLHVPLTDETHYMVDEKFIKKFKNNFWLINTSRGPVVKTNDMVKYLKTGKINGAALDVIEYEETSFEILKKSKLPEAYKFLIKADNVILTPHIAGWTKESKIKLAEVLADKIIKGIKK